jgi:hypothetical protein
VRGVASVSDRLDIVRFIDSKVTATRRTVARSKQLAEAAKDDLTTHKEWLERHRRRAQEDSERYQRRLGRRRRVEGCKRFALWLLLLVPSACAAMLRAACRGLAAVGETFYFGCCWIGTTAHALSRRLIRLITGSVSLATTTLLTLALWVAAAFWLVASGLGVGAGRAAVSAFGAGERGMSWLGPRSRSLNHLLARALTSGCSGLAALTTSLGAWLIGMIEGLIKTFTTLRQEGTKRSAERLEPSLDPRRLRQAAVVRLHAEHDGLQARIHAMDRNYGSRVPARGRPDVGEWAQLRKLGRDARRLFEIQKAEMLGPDVQRGNARLLSQQPSGALAASVRPSTGGHSIVEPPAWTAVPGQNRRTRHRRRRPRFSPSAS